MKRLIFSLFVLTTILFATVTVDGYAYLENQSDHSGINVIFKSQDTGTVSDSVTTEENGYFTVQAKTNNYFITYEKDGYFSEEIKPRGTIEFDANTTLSSITLIKRTKLIKFANFIENKVVDNYRKLNIPQKILERIQPVDTTSQTPSARHHQSYTSQPPDSEPVIRFSKNTAPPEMTEKAGSSDQPPASNLATRFSKNVVSSDTSDKAGVSDQLLASSPSTRFSKMAILPETPGKAEPGSQPAITTKYRSTRQLPAKTKMGAMVRSLMFPGLGQFYADRKIWGYGWIAAEVVAGGLIVMNYSDYKTANDDYNYYYTSYANATDPVLIDHYKTQSQNSKKNLESARDDMINMVGIAGVVWIANVIHAYMVGPKLEVTAYNEIPLQLAYDQYTDQFKLSVSIPLD